MWCHKPCTGLSAEAYKGLELQSKEVGTAYWACRACLSFATKVNRQLQETSRRQDEIEARVETNAGGVRQNAQDIESLRQELRRVMAKMDDEREARDAALCEELRDRELRRLNLIIHGLPEPAQSISGNRDRAEADRRLCSDVFATIGVRTRGHDLKFCRRVGERGRDPRPLVIGIRTEEERRQILDRARTLQGTRFDNIAVVPDMTRMQRRAEDQLASEAEAKNQQLSAEDRERNLRWLVVGRRGEKRLIKGTENQPQRERGRLQFGDFLPSVNETELGARRRDNFPPPPVSRPTLSPFHQAAGTVG
jgi:hypothetical protein